MEETVRATLLANAGMLLQYRDTTLLLDGIYGREPHFFSDLKPGVWEQMLRGEPPFEKIDYLLFSHAHPDHFSPEMTMEFLRHRRVRGVFLPDSHKVTESGLEEFLTQHRIPFVRLTHETEKIAYQVEPGVAVRGLPTRHLDKKFRTVHHLCYLLTFGKKKVLFTADVDYTQETFESLRGVPLRAAFVNPLFFSALRHHRFFGGELNVQTLCAYHVPFSGEDEMKMRPALARDLVEWPVGDGETAVLCDAFQRIEL